MTSEELQTEKMKYLNMTTKTDKDNLKRSNKRQQMVLYFVNKLGILDLIGAGQNKMFDNLIFNSLCQRVLKS